MCLGAPAGLEPPEIAEAAGEATEETEERDSEPEHGARVAPRRISDAPLSGESAVERGRAVNAAPGALAAYLGRVFPLAPLSWHSLPPAPAGAHARITQLLIDSVPTRGPTLLS